MPGTHGGPNHHGRDRQPTGVATKQTEDVLIQKHSY